MKNKKGSTIIWAVMLIMVLMVIVGASLSFAYMSYNQSIKNRNKIQAELIANSAIKSLVSVIENDSIKIPDNTTPKQITSMKLVDSDTDDDINSFGTISDIYVKRKTENGKVASAYLTANYAGEKYTIYGYLVYSNNAWKCVQYDTNGNRDITVNNTGDDNGNTGGGDNTGGSDHPDISDSSVINEMFNNVTTMMNNYYYVNDKNLDTYYEWYKKECQANNADSSTDSYANPFTDNRLFNRMYNRLYMKNVDQSPSLEDNIYTKVQSIRSEIFWNKKLYLHVYLIPNSTNSKGDFVIIGNQHDGSWDSSNDVNLLYIDNKIYVKKNGQYNIPYNTTLDYLRNVVRSDEWQELK